MEMPTPPELVWLVAVLAVASVVLVGLLRQGRWVVDGRLRIWVLIEDLAAYFLFLGMFVASTMQILIRYALADVITMPWTEEFTRLLMVWAALWGAAAVQRTDSHIAMTVVYDFLPAAAKRWVRLFGDAVTLAALAPVVWFGWETARSLDVMYTIALGLPLSIFAYPIPIGGALVMAHTVRLVVLRMRDQPVPAEPEPGV